MPSMDVVVCTCDYDEQIDSQDLIVRRGLAVRDPDCPIHAKAGEMTPERVAECVGQSPAEWREAKEILGDHWDYAWRPVADLAVRSIVSPTEIARILVGGRGYQGLLAAFTQS